jgi:hypothetical protein
MKVSDLVLSCGPPLLAIAMQMFPIPNDRWLGQAAADEQAKRHFPDAAKTSIKETARGALAVAGLGPTVISYATGAYALFMTTAEERKDLLNIYLFVVIITALVAIVGVGLLLGKSLFRVATGGIRIPLIGFGPTPATCLGVIVYVLNGLLIALAVSLYKNWLPEFH